MAKAVRLGDKEALRRLSEAESDADAIALEAQLLVQTDNRPREGDGVQPEESGPWPTQEPIDGDG